MGVVHLAFPVDYGLGAGCYIQKYHNHDLGPEVADYTCGPLSYDGHDCTDIALPTHCPMAAGVNVLAAPPGVVKDPRDGVADAAPFPTGQGCGNGVVIDHGDGWETQYCHLKQGSVRIAAGETVTSGTVLGQIGQSAPAEFPHLHFAVRHEDAKIDPFAPEATACGAAADDLWASNLPNLPGGILGLGLTDHVPEFDVIKPGLPSQDLARQSPRLGSLSLFLWPQGGGCNPVRPYRARERGGDRAGADRKDQRACLPRGGP